MMLTLRICNQAFLVCVFRVYLLVGLLLRHCGRYKAWLAGKNMTIQVQRGDMIPCEVEKHEQALSLVFFEGRTHN